MHINKATNEVIQKAVNEDSFNEALCIVQEAIGQDDGRVASIHFSGNDKDEDGNIILWKDKSKRMQVLNEYLKSEQLYSRPIRKK